MAPSPAVGAKIREEAAKLEEFYGRITSCRVMIEIPHRSQNGGYRFHVRIDLTVPGAEVVVNHDPTLHCPIQRPIQSMDDEECAKTQKLSTPQKDVYMAIRDAFKTARRRLQEYAQRQNGAVKHHETNTEKNLHNG
jgi:ribosome-associated translation inhibitor RaiA